MKKYRELGEEVFTFKNGKLSRGFVSGIHVKSYNHIDEETGKNSSNFLYEAKYDVDIVYAFKTEDGLFGKKEIKPYRLGNYEGLDDFDVFSSKKEALKKLNS